MSECETPICPVCENANHVVLVSNAQKVGTAVGGAAGTVSGYLGAETGVVTGRKIESLVPVVGCGIAVIACGLAGALAGFFAGASVGNKIGEQIDRHVICEYHCNRCGTEFEI